MKKVSIRLIISTTIIAFSAIHHFSSFGYTNDTLFFKGIEKELRADYKTCTGDSSRQPLKKILLWKQSIDSITQKPEFTQILKQFYSDSSSAKIPHLPCEIVTWYKNKVLLSKKSDSIAGANMKNKQLQKADSLFVINELSTTQKSSCDFMNIPFGISKRSVSKLLKDAGFTSIIDDTNLLHFTNPLDSTFNTLAFYFDKEGKYYKYEIESITASLDSLDTYIRPIANKFASHFLQRTGKPPLQNNFVGRLEIIQGKLSISKFWRLPNVDLYTGLATFNNRYYAKAVIIKNNLKKPHGRPQVRPSKT